MGKPISKQDGPNPFREESTDFLSSQRLKLLSHPGALCLLFKGMMSKEVNCGPLIALDTFRAKKEKALNPFQDYRLHDIQGHLDFMLNAGCGCCWRLTDQFDLLI
jgi:hypothetical protein